ncbi:MAG: DUF4399 domain-containing protein [Steroidobacteraceae bacterium]
MTSHMRAHRFAVSAAVIALLGAAGFAAAQVQRTPAPKGAEVYFISPKDGDTVTSPLTVKFGLKGMGVAPAGISFDNTGHHHLLVDAELKNMNGPIPADANHLHFGKGQTETTLELTPGKHTLQLVLGDHLHVPHQPAVMSQKITITVK